MSLPSPDYPLIFTRAAGPAAVYDSLSEPMRMLVSRLAVLVAGALVGVAIYALGGGPLAVPLAAVGAIVIGEVVFLAAGGD